ALAYDVARYDPARAVRIPIEIGLLKQPLAERAGRESKLDAHVVRRRDPPHAIAESVDAKGAVGFHSDLGEVGETEVGGLKQRQSLVVGWVVKAEPQLGQHVVAAISHEPRHPFRIEAVWQSQWKLPVALDARVQGRVVVVVALRMDRRREGNG